MNISTILFDFDYTLAYSSQGVFECVNYALNKMGYPKFSYEEICKTIGLSLHKTFTNLTGKPDENEARLFSSLFVERADQVMSEFTHFFDFVPDTLRVLKSHDYKLGIVSTKFRYRIETILTRENLLDIFDIIVGGEDVIKDKPDPEGLNMALTKLSTAHENCLCVGDSTVDGELSFRGYVKFIGVCTGTTKAEEFDKYNPLFVCDSAEHIPDLLFH